MNVLGIDPSLTGTGAALWTGSWQTLTIKSSDKHLGHLGDAMRIRDNFNQLRNWARGPVLDLVVIEAPAYSRAVGKVHERGGFWWKVYTHYALDESLPVLVVEPNLRTKYATGSGVAGKDAVMLAAAKRYPDAPITNNNEADAVLVADMGLTLAGHPTVKLPQTHLAAMKTLTWPAQYGG